MKKIAPHVEEKSSYIHYLSPQETKASVTVAYVKQDYLEKYGWQNLTNFGHDIDAAHKALERQLPHKYWREKTRIVRQTIEVLELLTAGDTELPVFNPLKIKIRRK